MKSSRIKRIILAVLLFVAAYIWWGNLRSFQSPSMQDIPEQQSAVNERQSEDEKQGSIAYVEPKVNPFKKKTEPDISQTGRPPRSRVERPQPRNTPSPPSTRCTLKGLVRESQTPQAVIVFEDKTSTVLSVHDSLDTWQLIEIRDSMVVFKLEKAHDTLWLDGKKP